ncbi:MAG: tetratricopeptide repeat protein [Leadbetterella sp.]|nr:tetratricopeptide repeat protein [Leadbetterella sp.]
MYKLSILLWFICFTGTAQTPMNKDSLLRQLPGTPEDTTKVFLYLEIGNQYEFDNPNTAARYYLKARDLSEKLNYKRGLVKFASNYTAILNNRGQLDSALILNKQALALSKELKDTRLIGISSANLGNNFNFLGNYDSTLYHYETALRSFEQMGDTVMVARTYDLIQNLYNYLRQYDKALQYGKKALAVLRHGNDPIALCHVLANIGTQYLSLRQFDEALSHFNEALAIAKSLNYKAAELTCYLNIGDIHLQKLDIPRMRPFFEKALTISREIESVESEAIATRGMAIYYLFSRNEEEAYKYILAAAALTEKTGFRLQHIKNLETMSSILFALGRYEEAENVLKIATDLNNAAIGDDAQQATALLAKQFETEKKEARIQLQEAQLRQKNIFNYLLLGGAAALGLISLLGYRNYRHKRKLQQAKIDELETEKQLTATEAVLRGEEQERTRLAKDLHDGLGGMLSGIKYSFQNMRENLILTPDNAQSFERSLDMLDSSIREMRRVAHNLMPEVLVRYGLDTALKEFCDEISGSGAVRMSYQWLGTGTVEQSVSLAVYRIVQELVNNALKHAKAENVLVQVHLHEGLLSVTVEDDGKGFDTALLRSPEGIGWNNIRNRVDFLKGNLDVRSSPGNGTSVLVEITL